jgi:hypothetical protein
VPTGRAGTARTRLVCMCFTNIHVCGRAYAYTYVCGWGPEGPPAHTHAYALDHRSTAHTHACKYTHTPTFKWLRVEEIAVSPSATVRAYAYMHIREYSY